MPFGFYAGLSRRKKAIYRRSDVLTEIPLPDPEALRSEVEALREALETGAPRRVQRAADGLCRGVTEALGAAPVDVKVRARRPRSDESELHGLYELEESKRGLIQIWMRTASRREVVAFRTFLRTLVHELCHHLDFAYFDLAETFHTEGFFRRESSLVRKLDPGGGRRQRKIDDALSRDRQEIPPRKRPAPPEKTEPAGPVQLELPID
jgi:hypothetical protein